METKKKEILFSDYVKKDLEFWKKLDHGIDGYAKDHGVSRTVIFDILNGKYNAPSPLTAVRMCDWFDMEPDDLCELITNADEKFMDKFIEKYNGGRFTENCKKAIEYFFRRHFNDYLCDCNEPYEHDCSFDDYSLDDLNFINTDESSIYDRSCCNATCKYQLYDVDRVYDGDSEMLFPTEYITCHSNVDYELSLYYLPSRRIRKNSAKTYLDERIRDFVNKFMYLITAKNPPRNNLFITTSEKLYMEIEAYMRGINISTKTDVGIAIICCPYRKSEYYKTIISNTGLMRGDIF